MALSAKQIVRRVAVRKFGDKIGCLDGSCIFGHPGGMQTNGGCGCAKEVDKHQFRQIIYMLSDIARTLACVAEVGQD